MAQTACSGDETQNLKGRAVSTHVRVLRMLTSDPFSFLTMIKMMMTMSRSSCTQESSLTVL
jgi:hypothetical protein